MKNILAVVTFILLPFLCFSQGITFQQGSWSEVLALAKKTNKPVFVDIYTSWCGPCKTMSNDVFPLKSVGDVYNAQFVCYQIDAEKGEGVEIARKYNVNAYPTYLFVKADGTLFSLAVGSMKPEAFIEVSEKALKDFADPRTLLVLEAEYQQRKKDTVFLLEYMNKRSDLGLPILSFFNDYLQLIPPAERMSNAVLNLYKKEGNKLKVSDFAYQLLLKNREAYLLPLNGIVDSYLQEGAYNTVREAARSKDEALLNSAITAFSPIIPLNDALAKKEELYMEYYKITKESDKYLEYATLHCNNNLMKIEPESISKKLNDLKQQVFDQLKEAGTASSNQIDTTQVTMLLTLLENVERQKICAGLNSTAWTVFETVSDVAKLREALRWSDRSLVFDPKNVAFIDTNANILYKLGRKEEAIKKQKQAVAGASGNEVVKALEENLKKMEAGEKTW